MMIRIAANAAISTGRGRASGGAAGRLGAEVDADAELDQPVIDETAVALDHAALHLDGAAHRIDDAGEFRQEAVACGLDDAALMLADFRVDQFAAMRLEALQRAFLVDP